MAELYPQMPMYIYICMYVERAAYKLNTNKCMRQNVTRGAQRPFTFRYSVGWNFVALMHTFVSVEIGLLNTRFF